MRGFKEELTGQRLRRLWIPMRLHYKYERYT